MQRLINLALLIFSAFCYLEWADRSAFLYEVEYALFFKTGPTAESMTHPMILVPILGQLLLLFAVIKTQKNYRLTFIGMGFLSLLVLMILLTGILAQNIRIIGSTLPFIAASVWAVVAYRKWRKEQRGTNKDL